MELNSAKLRASIEAITDLPTLPAVVSALTRQVANPSTNAADIGRLIEQDQALTVKVLRLVNSAYYGFPKQIKSIQHAVVILGFSKVKTIVTTASVFGLFSGKRDNSLDLSAFWQHSLAAAIAAKMVAEMLGVAHASEEAFIGGLLHDIGKVVMDQFQSELYRPVFECAKQEGILLREAEEKLMGLNHCKVGEWLTERWRLPPAIVDMVSYHHLPARAAERRELAACVHLGDILARSIGVGNGGDRLMPRIDPVVASNMGLDEKFLDLSVTRLIGELEKAMDFFSLVGGG